MISPPKPISQTDVYVIARKLRHLMTCHDKATHQIILLDSRIRDTVRRHRRLLRSPMCNQLRMRLEERISIYEWMRSAYAEYRYIKWVNIQGVIFTIFNGLYIPQTINSIISLATHHLYSGSAHSSMELDSSDDLASDDEEDMDTDNAPPSDSSFVTFQGDRLA